MFHNRSKKKSHKNTKHWYRVSIYQLSLGGIMTAIATLLGIFGTFTIGGSGVYLISIVLFLMPLVLRLPMLIFSTIISVVLSDLFTGYIGYTWISCMAYLSAVLIIWLLNSLITLKITYLISTFVASLLVVAIFYLLSLGIPVFNHAQIINNTIATSIEVLIAFVVTNILYLPFKLIPKGH